jgi:hypothetical protein
LRFIFFALSSSAALAPVHLRLGEFLTSTKPYRPTKQFFTIHDDEALIKGATTTAGGAAKPHQPTLETRIHWKRAA